jgi:hypothetical protein
MCIAEMIPFSLLEWIDSRDSRDFGILRHGGSSSLSVAMELPKNNSIFHNQVLFLPAASMVP